MMTWGGGEARGRGRAEAGEEREDVQNSRHGDGMVTMAMMDRITEDC